MIFFLILFLALVAATVGGSAYAYILWRRDDNDDWPFVAMLSIVGWVMTLILLGLATIPSSPILEGHCYQAVRHNSTTYIPVNGVVVPSTTSGIDLVDVPCR